MTFQEAKDNLIDYLKTTGKKPSPSIWLAPAKSNIIPKLFSAQQVADRFGVTLRVVQEQARSKKIGRKLGRRRWFTENEIFALMKEDDRWDSSSNAVMEKIG